MANIFSFRAAISVCEKFFLKLCTTPSISFVRIKIQSVKQKATHTDMEHRDKMEIFNNLSH